MAIVSTSYSAKTVANYFLELGARDRIPIDPLKLQKLVYLAHGWSLAILGRPLIQEPVEAWRYGPVIQVLYKEFKRFGASAIPEDAKAGGVVETLDSNSKGLIDAVWEKYRSLSSIQLSTLTHERGYAWDLTRKSGDFSPWDGPIIPNDLIADEFNRRQQQKS